MQGVYRGNYPGKVRPKRPKGAAWSGAERGNSPLCGRSQKRPDRCTL